MKLKQKADDEEKLSPITRDDEESAAAIQTKKILSLIKKNNGYVTTSEMVKVEVNPYYIHVLLEYAKICRVQGVLNHYLEVLI